MGSQKQTIIACFFPERSTSRVAVKRGFHLTCPIRNSSIDIVEGVLATHGPYFSVSGHLDAQYMLLSTIVPADVLTCPLQIISTKSFSYRPQIVLSQQNEKRSAGEA